MGKVKTNKQKKQNKEEEETTKQACGLCWIFGGGSARHGTWIGLDPMGGATMEGGGGHV